MLRFAARSALPEAAHRQRGRRPDQGGVGARAAPPHASSSPKAAPRRRRFHKTARATKKHMCVQNAKMNLVIGSIVVILIVIIIVVPIMTNQPAPAPGPVYPSPSPPAP